MLSVIFPKRIKLESSSWAQKKCLKILFPPVMVTFGLRSSANRRLKLPSVMFLKAKDNPRPKILSRAPSGTLAFAVLQSPDNETVLILCPHNSQLPDPIQLSNEQKIWFRRRGKSQSPFCPKVIRRVFQKQAFQKLAC